MRATTAIETAIASRVSLELDEEYIAEIAKMVDATTTPIQERVTTELIAAMKPRVPIAISAGSSLASATWKMNIYNIGCLVVTDAEGKLIGIFTERDVLMRVAGIVEDLTQAYVADYMTAEPISLKAGYPIADAIYLMSHYGFPYLPLVDDNDRPEGIISFRDVVAYLNLEMDG